MRKKNVMKGMWKRVIATSLAVMLALGGLDFGAVSLVAKAESTNLFTDGDFGDDDTDESSIWTNQNWYFEGTNWSAVNTIEYNQWAAQGGDSGLEINYGATDAQDGTANVYQTITALEAGNYIVTGYVKETAGKLGTVQLMYGSEVSTDTVDITGEFAQFTFEFTLEEAVADYNVGVCINSYNGAWVCLDTLTLTKEGSTTVTDGDADDTAGVVYLEDMEDGALDFEVVWSGTAATSKAEAGAGNNTTTVWNLWTSSAQTATLSKTLELEAGNYKVSVDTAGADGTGTVSISDGTDTKSADLTLGGWNVYTTATTDFLTLSEPATVTVAITYDFIANGYAKTDNIKLEAASDEEVEAAITAEKTAKLETLNALITECKALSEEDYTTATFEVLKTQLLTAESFYSTVSADLSKATVAEIVSTINDLQAARDALASATIVEAEIFVDKLDLSADFIKGVDISSYAALIDSGVTYFDFEGNELDEAGFFTLLKDSGVNWVRIRVWNNPYDSEGNGYGGGNNDINKAKRIGKLATDAGLKVLIDFHYSDFWADPDSQAAPKAWEDYSLDEKVDAVYDFTLDSLTALNEAGVDVRMVQIGNETNNKICGESGWTNMSQIFNAGSLAVRAYEEAVFGEEGSTVEDGSEVMVALHFTEPHKGVQAGFASELNTNNVDYDVFATSYYPFWHGTLENLNTVLSDIAATYNKKVMVAETSYAYTFEDGDGHENNVRASEANSLALNYNISVQGQANAVSDVMETIGDTTNGIGMFYWEPAWIPVQVYDAEAENAAEVLASNKAKWEEFGSGWASSYSGEYDPTNAGLYYGGSSWDNQALFDHNGNPHDSLNVFKYVDTGATTDVKLDGVESCEVEFTSAEEVVLPKTVTGIYNDGTTAEVPVTWNAEQVAAIDGFGSYTIEGIADGMAAVCNVEILPVNLLVNGGFEDGIEDGNGWTINLGDNNSKYIKIVTDDIKRGTNALKFDAWSSTLTDVTVTQTVDNLKPGIYSCFMNVEGAGTEGSYTISISATGDTEAGTDTASLLGWMVWDKAQVDNIVLNNGGSIDVTISITTTALETWGTIDEVYLYLVEELTPATEITLDTAYMKLLKGNTQQLTANMIPEDTTDTITWSSSDEKVATVSQEGLVLAVAAGEATITATTTSGKTASCEVAVYEKETPDVSDGDTTVSANDIVLDKTAVSLNKGETTSLKATMTPDNTTDTITWSTSNPKVATVSQEGLVLAVAAGEATITATTTSGKTATCTVTVNASVEPEPTATPTPTATPEPTAPPTPVTQEEQKGVTYKVSDSGAAISKIDKNATSVTIPATITTSDGQVHKVTSIAKNAAKGNTKLTKVVMGSNITSIGDYAFYGCKNLKTVTIGKNVTTIGKCAFAKNISLTKITIPDKVKTVGSSAFDDCTKLKTVKLGKSLTAISDKMFYKCSSLTKVTIPSKVTKIGKSAFANCTKLSSVTIGKKVSSIGASAFYKCSALKKVTIPSSVKNIGGSAFSGCTKLATLTIGSKVATIDKNAFSKCSALKKVTIPASVKTIGANAFNGCKNLKSITIKTTKLTTKNVGNKAFGGINSKATIKVPAKKLADYKTLLIKKGVKKTATIKK